MGLRYIVIVENKDTYQEMPMIRDGLCVFGSGSAAPNGLRLLPFLYDDSASELRAIYWGDMDADGLEILAAVRGTGIECESLFMDRTAYDRYRRYGTDKDEHGRTIARHACKPMSGLHAKEQELYETLCEGGSATYPRIEQERIPLSTAAEELRSRNVPAVDL